MNSDQERDFLGAFDQNWDHYRKQFKAGRQEISEETVHDLRVAARRFQALFSILRQLYPHPHIKKVGRFLRKQLDQLDEVHDAEVMMQEASQRVQSLPQLGPFRDFLQAKLDTLTGAARKQIRKSKPSDLKQHIKRIRKTAKKHLDEEDLVERLLRIVDAEHARTIEALGELSAQDPTTIHHVRMAFKKFRYMIETIQPLIPDYPASLLDKMRGYQDAMGKVRDTTVFLDTLKEFETDLQQRGQGQAPSFDPQPIESFYQTRLDELIQAYFARKDEFNTFWRAASDEPFPWENSHEPVHRTARDRGATGQSQQRRRGQPATPHRRGAKKVRADRTGTGSAGDPGRPDPDQSVPTGG